MTDDERQLRLAKNESFFRESNEILERDAIDRGTDKCDFICECSQPGCLERLVLTRREYEHIRAKGNRFVVEPGHEDSSFEIVVERHPSYLVVEKQGQAGAVARSDDPR
jgi:hypothetical protein